MPAYRKLTIAVEIVEDTIDNSQGRTNVEAEVTSENMSVEREEIVQNEEVIEIQAPEQQRSSTDPELEEQDLLRCRLENIKDSNKGNYYAFPQ